MLYTTNNLQISFTAAFATFLRSKGFDIHWHATGDTEAQTAGLPEAKGTVTLVPEFPANPTTIVRLKGDSIGSEEIVIPAFSLRVVGPPERVVIRGLGHKDYQWRRNIRVDGFAADEFQHRLFVDLLHEWLQSEEFKAFDIYDHTTDPAVPTLIGQAWIEVAAAEHQELVHEVEAVRYYVTATAVSTYIE